MERGKLEGVCEHLLKRNEEGIIISVSWYCIFGKVSISIGDKIRSNGSHGAPRGREGRVMSLNEPDNLLNGFIEVLWEGQTNTALMRCSEITIDQ